MNPYIKTKSVPQEKVHSMLNPPQGGVRSKGNKIDKIDNLLYQN